MPGRRRISSTEGPANERVDSDGETTDGKRTAQYNSAVDSCNQCRTHWRNARMIACCFAMRPLWNADEIMPLKSMAADAIVLKRPYQFCQ